MSGMYLVGAIGLLILGLGLWLAALIRAEGRRRQLAAWARSQGFHFRPGRDAGLAMRYPHFDCLQQGDSSYGDNFIQGRVGQHAICAFDFHCAKSQDNEKNKRRHFSVVIFTTNLPLTPLVIRQHGLWDRFAALAGFDQIELESAEFNREFQVCSPDRRWAFDVLPQATMQFLLNSPRFVLELRLCQVIAYRDHLFTSGDFTAAIQVIEGILGRLPNYLKRELSGVDG